MSEWLAPVLAALIAAVAVVFTNVYNTRTNAAQREAEAKERDAVRKNEMIRWHAELDETRRRWLLDRRAEAYMSLLEWSYRDDKDPKKEELRSTIEVPLRAYGSQAAVEAYDEWVNMPWEGDEPNPWWRKALNRMRDDVGSNDSASPSAR